jgi:RNase P subunit RPR2
MSGVPPPTAWQLVQQGQRQVIVVVEGSTKANELLEAARRLGYVATAFSTVVNLSQLTSTIYFSILLTKELKGRQISNSQEPGGRVTMAAMPEAYCVKCKAKRVIKDPSDITMKNGRKAVTGTCSVCGTKLFRIGGEGK